MKMLIKGVVMESEKVKEIKKALKCCSTEDQANSCFRCPYRLNFMCSWGLTEDALTLINELESENERLKKALVDNLKAYNAGYNDAADFIDEILNKY